MTPLSAPAGSSREGLRDAAVRSLLAEAEASGRWIGELSSSALSTATAACALELVRRERPAFADANRLGNLVREAVAWLGHHQNEDGGWGDTTESPSNVSTTVLSWVALGLGGDPEASRETLERAERRLREWVDDLTPENLAEHLLAAYGDDRTFSIPILTTCALGGRFGDGPGAWASIQAIPFELAAVPSRWFRRLGLPMVSYALPALIAMGQVHHHHRPTRNPLLRWIRNAAKCRTLEVLRRIQPGGGGFLEAAPLTSFVTLSLVGCGLHEHAVVERAVSFLSSTVREDGSWPIDTDLSLWLTSLSVSALARGGRLRETLSADTRASLRDWLLAHQHRRVHPYTDAAPGGWAWTNRSGGVPDADDTSAALVALWHLARAEGEVDDRLAQRAAEGVEWILDLQNRDGGVPTFCRGWGRLPFDRSSPDLTAHALRAWLLWRDDLEVSLRRRADRAGASAVRYLLREQREDGTWVPLWFGNQHEPSLENPVYGTARVLLAVDGTAFDPALESSWREALERGRDALLGFQNGDGGWGGGGSSPSTVEETALAVEALVAVDGGSASIPTVGAAVERAVAWLGRATRGGTRFPASPIGLYFAKLWYSERLYPMIFGVGALEGATAPRGSTT